MKKIAVAQMNETEISKHFGRSPFFGIYSIYDGKITEFEMRMNIYTHHMNKDKDQNQSHESHGYGNQKHSHNHKSIVEGLEDCQAVISRGMGLGAIQALSSSGIEIFITDESGSKDAVLKYVRGELRNLNKVCNGSLKE